MAHEYSVQQIASGLPGRLVYKVWKGPYEVGRVIDITPYPSPDEATVQMQFPFVAEKWDGKHYTADNIDYATREAAVRSLTGGWFELGGKPERAAKKKGKGT